MEQTIKIKYSKYEYIRWKIEAEYFYTGAFKKYIPLYIILIAIVILGGFVYKNYFSSIFSLVVMTIVPVYIYIYVKSSVEKEFNNYYKYGFQLIIKEDGFDFVDYENNKTFVSKNEIMKIYNAKEIIIIYLSSYINIIIPKKCINKEIEETILKLI